MASSTLLPLQGQQAKSPCACEMETEKPPGRGCEEETCQVGGVFAKDGDAVQGPDANWA